jgi:hypothetical protein
MDELLDKAFSEYGLLVAVLLISVYVLFKRTISLTDYIMTTLQESNIILNELVSLIKGQGNDK